MSNAPDDPTSKAGEAEHLAEAFRIFSQASDELSAAYSELQGQVAQLTAELAAANGQLRQQYQEKAALTERLSQLLDALPAAVIVLDEADQVVQANPAAAQLFGIERLAAGWASIAAAMREAEDAPDEFDLDERRLAVAVTRLESSRGRIVLLHDITEAHALKAQAERTQRLAAMGEMAAQVAHQLRTPLAAALLYAGNLENPDLPEARRVDVAQKTVARLKHLERLIQDMLLFARGEVLGREQFAVAELLAELAHTFEPLARRRQVEFEVRDDAGAVMLTGNRKSVAGALTSFLENALQFVDDGGQVVLAASCDEMAVRLSVRDNGRGMTPEVAARLFEPFYTTRAEGTGLGLAIARGVARAHGGSVDVVSSPGAGAEFILTLPLSANPEAAEGGSIS